MIVEFTIDEQGRVVDPHIIDSSSTAGSGGVFHEAALDSVKKFRSVPRFEDGVAVRVPDVRTRISFVLDN